MKILHLCYSDLEGGAARAAYRLHQAQRSVGLNSHMLVINKCSDDPYVHTVSLRKKLRIKAAATVARRILKFQKTRNPIHHSLNLFPSGLPSIINELSPDIVNLHWVGNEMLSIGEIASLKQPIVWTLHDMWSFSGCEHYDDDLPSERYSAGYSHESRHTEHRGLDLDRWIFQLKKKAWFNKRFHIVAPSSWLAVCVQRSTLFAEQSVKVINNCIDHSVYRPLSRNLARQALGLTQGKKYLLFGAMSSTSDPRKGYHLLVPALQKLKELGGAENIELLIFGASDGRVEQETGIITHYMGRLHDDISLCLLYNAVELFIAPSLQDNLPNTLVEALACGTPCVAFDIGGIPDLLSSPLLGQKCKSLDYQHLAQSILSELKKSNERDQIVHDSKEKRSQKVIADSYKDLYVFLK
ncbi:MULTISPECIES: glycosyltransferase [unclassified Endozoicomonas]|uniref:glycosyltransferase n=1 Tax=unclassified Endozoicomonas TaxID=2644528 RepID=UPI003BB688DA